MLYDDSSAMTCLSLVSLLVRSSSRTFWSGGSTEGTKQALLMMSIWVGPSVRRRGCLPVSLEAQNIKISCCRVSNLIHKRQPAFKSLCQSNSPRREYRPPESKPPRSHIESPILSLTSSATYPKPKIMHYTEYRVKHSRTSRWHWSSKKPHVEKGHHQKNQLSWQPISSSVSHQSTCTARRKIFTQI